MACLWLFQRLDGWDWELGPYLFLWLVRGVILPMMFYGAHVWHLLLCSSTRWVELDSVLACVARMAFRFESNTHVEPSLVLSRIELARYHILQLLVRYSIWRHREVLVFSYLDPIIADMCPRLSWSVRGSKSLFKEGHCLTLF